jgi:RNA polymerase sigma-54 factor
MAISAKLELRQSQQLVMTPQLQQAIRLLQYSNLEVDAFVEAELERNPLLEREDEAGVDSSLSRELTDEALATLEARGSTEGEQALDLTKPVADVAAGLDTEYDNVFPDTSAVDLGPDLVGDSWTSVRQRTHLGDAQGNNLEAFVASEVSLKEHLADQARLALKDPAERLIGQFLIDLVDEDGYLNADLEALADKLGAPSALVVRVFSHLQAFDPPGVFARNLAECLALQLKEQNRFDSQIAKLLNHLDLLAAHNLPALCRLVGVEMDELADMIAELKRLNPKPGLQFGSAPVQTVVPDVVVRPAGDGSWIVELNTDTLPRVLVNRAYYARVSRTARSPHEKDYLLDCLQTANWLVKSLDQRARTILRVAEEIVRQQDGFLTHGVQHLRPLNLKTVADAISMHESTVSRVTSNKYIATPRGIFELKYFFTSAIAAAGDGAAHSSESVRHRIRQLIDTETAQTVLSDDKIVERLKSDGIDIARRTVAKYREAMRIPSSVQRRREKRLTNRAARLV